MACGHFLPKPLVLVLVLGLCGRFEGHQLNLAQFTQTLRGAATPTFRFAEEQQLEWWTPAADIASLFDSVRDSSLSSSHNMLVKHPTILTQSSLSNNVKEIDPAVHMSLWRRSLTNVENWLHIVRITIHFTLLVKCLCILSNLVYQVSPLSLAKQFEKDKCTGDADSAPFVSVTFCSCQFCFYGMFAYLATMKSGFLVLVYSNVIGVTLGQYYVRAFLRNCKNNQMLQHTHTYLKVAHAHRLSSGFLNEACGLVMVLQLIALLVLPTLRALLLAGIVSSGCGFISAMSLVTTVPEVIRTKCSQALPLQILICAEISGLMWVLCGLSLWDPYITIPNVIGTVTATFALALIWYYPSEPSACSKDPQTISAMVAGETGGT